MRLAVLASGRGSNFKAIAHAAMSGRIPSTQIVGLICNKPDAGALEIARELGVPSFVITSKKRDRADYEKEIVTRLKGLAPDYICLAGYMLLLGPTLLEAYPKKILNIHPSLLPDFKGLHAQRQALDAGAKMAGCTVHWVTEKMDDGPILCQTRVPVLPGDTEESLSARILSVEHDTYISVLADLAQNRIK